MWQSRLSRHMYTVNKAEPQVTEALQPSTTSVERIHTFAAELRKQKICSSDTVCTCIPKRKFHKHKEICRPKTYYDTLSSVHVDAFKSMKTIEDEFTTENLSTFHNDNIGKVCRSYPIIVLIGRRRFQRNRRKVHKLMEIKSLP